MTFALTSLLQFNDRFAFLHGLDSSRRSVIPSILLISYQLCDLLDQSGFIYHIRKFRYNNTALAIWHRLQYLVTARTRILPRPVRYASSIPLVPRIIPPVGKSGPLMIFRISSIVVSSSVFDLIINDLNNCIDDFSQVMRRNICCHTYRNTGSTIYQKIRKSCRKYCRLLLCLIKVRRKINGILC